MDVIPIKSSSVEDFFNKISNLEILIYIANSNLFCEKEGIDSAF